MLATDVLCLVTDSLILIQSSLLTHLLCLQGAKEQMKCCKLTILELNYLIEQLLCIKKLIFE